ncbi:MAG: UDP-N-acetylglucosamine 4,6-dehydratase family protein [Candidatus Micrarchaeia archaeon]
MVLDANSLKKEFSGKVILVTGGAGSIGSEIVRQLVKLGPKAVRVMDTDETGLFDLEQELYSHKPMIAFLIGDVRDKDRTIRAMEGVDVVFHAAALKHVHLCEYNPFEAIKTNVLGTQNVIDACLNNNVKKMIFISTDKAVNPNNVMGASKLLCERLTIAANGYKGARASIFSCVRFGNVLASRGSVVPLFKEQIKHGGPVTVTDPSMTRFIMSIPNAVSLILRSTTLAKGGEIFILKMESAQVGVLAKVLVQEFAPKFNKKPEDIAIKIIGKRPGEKMDEELVTEMERTRAELINGEIIAVYPENHGGKINVFDVPLSSKHVRLLTEAEISKIVREMDFESIR